LAGSVSPAAGKGIRHNTYIAPKAATAAAVALYVTDKGGRVAYGL